MNNSPMRYVVVKLDNAKYGAGPGTVVGKVDNISAFNSIALDRDGAKDPSLRLWLGEASIGDRVSMKQGRI